MLKRWFEPTLETRIALSHFLHPFSHPLNAVRSIFSIFNGTAPDNAPPKYTHRHIFPEGTSREEQAQWLDWVKAKCERAGTKLLIQPVEKDGQAAYEFGFNSAASYETFVRNIFGDLETPEKHIHLHRFDDPEYQAAFQTAAETLLQACGITYKLETEGNALRLKFDRFSDWIVLRKSLDNGRLDAATRQIMHARQPEAAPLLGRD